MRVEKIAFEKIQYQQSQYSPNLRDSLIRIGISFPLRVKLSETGYECTDGHKRLSCIHDLLNEKEYSKLKMIPVIVENHTRTAPPMSMKNHH